MIWHLFLKPIYMAVWGNRRAERILAEHDRAVRAVAEKHRITHAEEDLRGY